MSEELTDTHAERMLTAALGGRTPHQALLDASREASADHAGRAAAIARNRERAEQLLNFLEQQQG